MLPQARLKPSDLKDPDRTLSLNAVATLLEAAAQEAKDACLGLHFGEYLPPGSAGVLGHLVMSAPTVRDAFRGVERYADLFISPMTISFAERAGRGILSWRFPDTFTAPRIQVSGLMISALLVRLQQGAGMDLRPVSADFDHRPFACPQVVRRILGSRVRFNRPGCQIVFDTAGLNRRIVGSHPGLFGLIGQLGDRLLEEHKVQADIVEMTRRLVAKHLRNGGSRLDRISRAFGIAPRTLQGRLRRAGTTFEDLVGGTRRRLAQSYLRDTDLTMTEIAFMLGFSELSAFTRAAHRWFRMSPTAYRRKSRTR